VLISWPSIAEEDSALWEVYKELEEMRQEIRDLRGQMEEQAYRLNILQQQQKGQYLDLDGRINQLIEQMTEAPKQSQVQPSIKQLSDNESLFKEEKAQYQAAKSLVEKRAFQEASTAFLRLLKEFPDGAFTAYAHYRLGEIFMVLTEPDFDKAETHFQIVLEKFPGHTKEGATLYKLGKLYHLQGNLGQARQFLARAISIDPKGKEGRIGKLAQKYLDKI